MAEKLEKMADFFAARADGYDEHMLKNVEGCQEGYRLMAQLVPKSSVHLLDLGCGTGLELDEIWKALPHVRVTGIDLCDAMLNKLKAKHKDKPAELICGDYFAYNFGISLYECAISFESLHHFDKQQKTDLYRKIYSALKPGGMYIECDYMAGSQEEEDALFAENARLRKEQNISASEYCHFDTPCCAENQIKMLASASFCDIKQVFKMGGTVMITAKK